MFKQNIARGTLVSALALALIATTAGVANAAAPVSDGFVGIFDPNEETYFAAGTVFDWNTETVGGQSTTNARATFECPTDTTVVNTFLSPVGSERTVSAWSASANLGNKRSVLEPTLTPESQILGTASTAKNAGGDYSLGIACLIDNGVNFASSGLWFTTIHVTAGSGKYTVDQPVSTTPVTGSPADVSLNASVATAAVVDGELSLVVASGAAAAINTTTIVDGKSSATGTLPDFTVKDARALTHKGWTLTSKVTDFVSGSTTIPAAQLTVTPAVKSTTAGGVTAATAAAASNTDVPFASATDSAQVGDTVLNAALKFVAPSASTPAGTYTSKMTLTLVSK